MRAISMTDPKEIRISSASCQFQHVRISTGSADVRFGSEADIWTCVTNVRFTPESGHVVGCQECPLCAKSGHQGPDTGLLRIPT